MASFRSGLDEFARVEVRKKFRWVYCEVFFRQVGFFIIGFKKFSAGERGSVEEPECH